MAGLSEILIHILELSDNQAMELALVENLQREDLNPLGAQGINELIRKFSFTHEQVATKLGWSRAAVTGINSDFSIAREVRLHLIMGTLTEGHARTILSLPTPDAVVTMAQLAIDRGLNVGQLEEMVRSDAPGGRLLIAKAKGRRRSHMRGHGHRYYLFLPSFSKICRKNK